jgi:hypothetical protein
MYGAALGRLRKSRVYRGMEDKGKFRGVESNAKLLL